MTTSIPTDREPLIDGSGRITRSWRNYLLGKAGDAAVAALQVQIDELRAEIEQGGGGSDVSFTGSFSVQVLGTAEDGFFIQLRNDTLTPDPLSAYSTDADGNKGWHLIPHDGVPYFIASDETYTVPLYKQALFSMPIEVAGLLVVDGFLVEVA